jgi:hypothetical protein
MTSTDYLTTSAMDCSGLADVQLRFRRWLGVESSAFDHARIDVSTNGVDWLPVWANGTTSISDTVWSLQTYDLSAVADGRATVLVRWGMGPTDSSVSYPGWNIDDVQIWARTPSPADLNGDSLVGEMDYRMFAACFDGPALTTATDCTCADLDADGDVDLVDFAGMQAEFGN